MVKAESDFLVELDDGEPAGSRNVESGVVSFSTGESDCGAINTKKLGD